MAFSRIARCVATLTNLVFLSISISLLFITLLSVFNPPKATVSPQRVNEYPQFVVTLLLIGCYATFLFVLSLLGLISLCFLNSILLFVFILGQTAMMFLLGISFAFTLTVRKRLHLKLEDIWRNKPNCLEGQPCVPLETFRSSENLLICLLVIFLVVQVIQYIASWYLCERRSSQEKYKLQLRKADEDDE
ncbi:transcellular chaperone signaling (x)cross tissue [Caenorhabditis elegans]|uniref:Transcellular chaperone signaling (X)cross tissue n=1 Tax=Caenorhabditis elegans TaxID=6239 RepID=Q93891_CAEEL|nr:transcellular chaperone signaling (x)cross tissue [Caenorhabditis elegans]CAB03201.2 transcellular chaperone signaling (x)cross tissue [Caenorhabditis elegans]|eukprot:NP_502446.2 Uncharacterized protein CELE_M02B1.2 [Caenorhabditis elegans]